MSAADQLRGEIDTALYDLAEAVNAMAKATQKVDDVNGTVMLIGLYDNQNASIAGLTNLGQVAKSSINSTLDQLFEMRQRLTVYRDKP